MLCATCGKDSTNRRVCPYCFTPYPPEDAAAGAPRRASTSVPRQTGTHPAARVSRATPAPAVDLRALVMRQSPLVRWSAAGILAVLLLWAFTGSGEPAPGRTLEPAPAETTPMTRDEAVAHIRSTRETALVETQADEVYVSYPAAAFPLEPAGQVALARRFARADELVEGRRRRIFFYGPNGKMFAQSDAVTGLTIVR